MIYANDCSGRCLVSLLQNTNQGQSNISLHSCFASLSTLLIKFFVYFFSLLSFPTLSLFLTHFSLHFLNLFFPLCFLTKFCLFSLVIFTHSSLSSLSHSTCLLHFLYPFSHSPFNLFLQLLSLSFLTPHSYLLSLFTFSLHLYSRLLLLFSTFSLHSSLYFLELAFSAIFYSIGGRNGLTCGPMLIFGTVLIV